MERDTALTYFRHLWNQGLITVMTALIRIPHHVYSGEGSARIESPAPESAAEYDGSLPQDDGPETEEFYWR